MIKSNNGITKVVNDRDPEAQAKRDAAAAKRRSAKIKQDELDQEEKARQQLISKVLTLQESIKSKQGDIEKEENMRREFQAVVDLQKRKEVSSKSEKLP